MDWFRSSVQLAAEKGPASWTFVAAERLRGREPRLIGSVAVDAQAESLEEDIRQFRMRERMPSQAALVLWPEPTDPGVLMLDSRSNMTVSVPKAKVIRERASPFVRAGGRVRELLLPHEAVGRLVSLAGWTSACVVVLDRNAACLAATDGQSVDATYLTWAPIAVPETDAARLLARYQFAARLAPYVRAQAALSPNARVVVCGRFPDLRSAMVPVVEEFDREVDVLDSALVGQSEFGGDPDEIAGLQLAWAVAAARRD